MPNASPAPAGPCGEYACELCHDFGFVHPVNGDRPDYTRLEPCRCAVAEIERKRQQALLRCCELPASTEKWTLDRFEVYPAVEAAYAAARELADESGPLRWLTLCSGVDNGKTHLAVGICRRWLARGKAARYGWVPLLMDELKRGMHSEEYDKRFEMLLNVPLLVLDDLGVENPTPWVNERLETIIDYRYARNLPLAITTNLPLAQLRIRIASRIQRMENSRVIVITAPEYRTRRDRP